MKKEFPFMPFYTQDWLADDKVSAYSYEEKGVYHEILVYLWQSDTASLLDDNAFLARLLKLSPRKFLSLRSVLIDGQFAALHSIDTPDGPRIVQDRLTAEWQKARDIHTNRKTISDAGHRRSRMEWLSVRRVMTPKILAKYNYQCQMCGNRENLQIDHILPLAKGGSNDESNLQVLCRHCNSSKGSQVPNEQ